MVAFPGPNNARTRRRLGIDHVVVHAGRIGGEGEEMIRVARGMPEYTLIAQDGSAFLFRVN